MECICDHVGIYESFAVLENLSWFIYHTCCLWCCCPEEDEYVVIRDQSMEWISTVEDPAPHMMVE